MTNAIEYHRYDVFTETPFAGNPLAVVVDPPTLSDTQHQQIAAEFNLSETVFLRCRPSGGWDARIFTPSAELPFAGHPTIGAALALADEGLVSGRVVLHEGVGPVDVGVHDGRATLTSAVAPTPVSCADGRAVAAALGLPLGALGSEPQGWSAGVPFTIVPVESIGHLAEVSVDLVTWRASIAGSGADALYLLAPADDGRTFRARMFAPGLGISEDPATGSAAAAAVGYLADRTSRSSAEDGWRLIQGVEMGRRSQIDVAAVFDDAGRLAAATVTGSAVRVGGGWLAIPST